MNGDLWRSYAAQGDLLLAPMDASIETILTRYLTERLSNEGTAKSARTYAKTALLHLGSARLCDLVAEPAIMVNYFRGASMPPSWGPKTLYNYRLMLRAGISYWIKSRALSCANPMNVVFLDPRTAIRENVPSPEQYARLLDVAERIAPPYIAGLITAAWETGLRMSEYLNWRWTDIDLTFREGLPWYSVYIRKQKRQLRRQMPMTQALWEMLSALPRAANTPEVWPISNPPYRILRRVFRQAGMAGIRLHDFRKSFKTYAKTDGWPKDVTKALQGHATDSMDSYYAIFGREHLSRFVAQRWNPEILKNQAILIPLDKRIKFA